METTRTLSRSATSAVSVYMRQVYGWMTAGLALTSVVAYAVASSPAVQMAIFSNSLIPIILIVAQFGLVIALSAAIHKMSGTTATGLFLLYSGLTILGCLVVMAICIGICNLLVDIIFAFVDPRIKSQYSKRG